MVMIFPGIADFRPGQKEIIESILNGSDTIAVLPTGGGKSLCFQYPSYFLKGLVVVVSPLVALMRDQVDQIKARGLYAGALYSGQSYSEKLKIFQEMSLGGQYILYLSPERVQKPGFEQWIKERQILLFAIDEAHCISQWGHDFRQEYAELGLLKQIRPDIPILALTASATRTVLSDVAIQLGLNDYQKKVYGFYRPNLYYQVEICDDDYTKTLLLKRAIQKFKVGRIIVYCGTRKLTESLYAQMSKNFQGCGYYHAGLTSDLRHRIQDEYSQSKIRVLFATNAFGMGIDQPDVRCVVHYQMPGNLDALYQEMGRAGRDGERSTCLLLFSNKDKGLQSYFISSSDASSRIKSIRWENLQSIVDYVDTQECRHKSILNYYGDKLGIKKRCGHCDNCDAKSEMCIKIVQ